MRRPGKKTAPAPPSRSRAPSAASAAAPAGGDAIPPISEQSAPYASDGLLQEDWADKLPLNAFDDLAFFREFDIAVDQPASFMERLEAAYRCFKPALNDGQSPLDLEDMDQPRLKLFFRRLLPAIGFGHMPIDRLASGFKQHLFQRWFLSLASPPSADGNGGPRAFPLQNLLLSLTYNKPALAKGCEGESDRPMLMRVDYLRDNIAAQFRREHPGLDGKAGEWIMASLLSIFEPTLLRPDLPPNFRYGSLEWTLLDMGMRMAGYQGSAHSHRELVGLAAAAEIGGDSDDGGVPGLASGCVGSMLRMAHANGEIDLRHDVSDAGMEAMLASAIALYRRELDALRRTSSIEALLAGLPTRGSVVAAELRHRGLDPGRKYWIRKSFSYGRDLLDAQGKPRPGLAFDAPHALIDFVMADCMWQLYEFGGLPPVELRTLERGLHGITHAGLNAAFASQFEAAFNAFADGVLARGIEEKAGALDVSDARFWQCGRPEVTLPTARIVAHIPPKPDRGATGVGRKITTSAASYTADRGIFVSLTLGTDAYATETRHYWITQEPFAVGRFDGDVAALLRDRLGDFFTPKNAGETLWKLDEETQLQVEIMHGDASLTVAQFAARRSLAPYLPALRERAFQMTAPEARLEDMTQALLDLLPFRACVKRIEEGEHYDAAFYCLLDVFAALPIASAGSRVVGNARKIVAMQTAGQAKQIAKSLMTGIVERNVAHAMVRDTLYVGKPMLSTGKQIARFFNPLDPLWSGFNWIRHYPGPLAAALLRRLRKTGLFRDLAKRIERDIALPCVREKGFWRAAPDAPVRQENGLRQLQIEGRNLMLSEIGEQHDVLTVYEGGRLHLSDPRDGGLLAPVISPAKEPWRNPGRSVLRSRSCQVSRVGRTKRGAEDAGAACNNLIEPAIKFGVRFHRVASEKKFEGVQRSVREMARGRKVYLHTAVDLNDLGFMSYTKIGPSSLAQSRPFNRYFTFEGKVWVAEDGGVRKTAIRCFYPDSIAAKVVRLNLPGIKYGGADYLRFEVELPRIPGDDRRYSQTFIAPYGTYAGPNGECMGMLDFPDASYKFKGSWINELKPGEVVTLRRVRGDDPDPQLFEQYRRINTYVRQDPDMFLPGSLYQLRDATPVMRLRFDAVWGGADKILAGALGALRNPTRDVKALLLKLLPESWKGRQKRRFVDAIENNIVKMIDALGLVKHNKYDVIGFGTARRTLDGSWPRMSLTYARAEALAGAFDGKMNEFPLIRHAVIYFDIAHFLNAGEEALVLDLVHELSHACLKTEDTISAKSTVPVYSRQSPEDRNEISIGELRAAWAEPDADPAMHAATNEVLVKLLAMAADPAQRRRLAGIMAGGDVFRLEQDAPADG